MFNLCPFILITSASLFGTLRLAMPLKASSDTVQVVASTGDGDVSAGLKFTTNQFFSIRNVFGSNGSEGVVAAIDDTSNIPSLQRPGQARTIH